MLVNLKKLVGKYPGPRYAVPPNRLVDITIATTATRNDRPCKHPPLLYLGHQGRRCLSIRAGTYEHGEQLALGGRIFKVFREVI